MPNPPNGEGELFPARRSPLDPRQGPAPLTHNYNWILPEATVSGKKPDQLWQALGLPTAGGEL